jgi:hypothetical protein
MSLLVAPANATQDPRDAYAGEGKAACLDDDQVAALARRIAILQAGGLTLVHKSLCVSMVK